MTTKQVKFLDKYNQEVHGGILVNNEALICCCCGGVFIKDEWENSGIEIVKEYNYWVNLDEEIIVE